VANILRLKRPLARGVLVAPTRAKAQQRVRRAKVARTPTTLAPCAPSATVELGRTRARPNAARVLQARGQPSARPHVMTARWATTRLRMAPHCALSAATASTAGTRRGRAAAPVTSAPRGTSRIFTASVSSATRVSSVTATALLGHTSEVCPSPRATTGSRKSQPSATSAGTLAYAAAETRRAQAAALLGRKGPCVPPARYAGMFVRVEY